MSKAKKLLRAAPFALALAVPSYFAFANSPASTAFEAKLKERLPNTKITSVDCDTLHDVCEVVAGANVFYTDRDARYLIIGRVYDLQERRDLTAARLLDVNPSALVGGAARPDTSDDEKPIARPAQARAAPSDTVTLAELPDQGALHWGAGKDEVTIFTDFRCGYCRLLVKNLEAMNVRVVERPISVLGTRNLSEAVICSADRSKAMRLAYADRMSEAEPSASKKCDTTGLDENERFATKHHFGGTPVVVRKDGAVTVGYRDPASLSAWIKGGA